jgi:hypothetical protein
VIDRIARCAIGTAVFAMLLALPLAAQTTTPATAPSVSGTVTSSSGNPIVNATIELENISTGAQMTATTDATGHYRFDNVPPGTYRIHTSSAQGTGTPSSDISVDSTHAKTVNITMQAGAGAVSTAALVTVEDATPVQGLETTQIRSAWNTRSAQYLPESNFLDRNGEFYGSYNLTLLNPGVANSMGIGTVRGPVVGGLPPSSNDWLLDGVDNNNRATGGPLVHMSNEATSEFVSYQNLFPPEYGHAAGGQFNEIERQGTNQVHGSLYWYMQNRNMNAVDQAYANQGVFQNPGYDQNRVGASLGMPIIPNKLFFFGNFEYIPLGVPNQPLTPVYGPTAAGFTALAGINGVSQTNLSVLQQYLPPAQTATSSTTVNGVQVPVGLLSFTGKNWQNQYNGTGAMDWLIGNSDNLHARYVQNEIDANTTSPTLPNFLTPLTDRSMFADVSEYHNFGASGINELRLGYTRYRHLLGNNGLVFPGLSVFPNISIQQDLNLELGQGFYGIGTSALNTYELTDNVNWTVGRHTFRFGADVRRYIGPLNFNSQGFGSYSFSNLAGFLLDQSPDVFGSRSFGNLTYSGNQWNTYGYVNDSVRVRPNLNLTVGLRYEYVSIPNTLAMQGLNSVADVPGVLTFHEPNTQKSAFAPRVGLAFAPTHMHDMVFRAGFGMNWDAQTWSTFLPSVPPGTVSTQFVNAYTPFYGFFGGGGLFPYPVNVFTPSVTPEQARAMTSTYIPDQTLPYTMQWNASVEQTVFHRFIVSLGYLGVKAVHYPVQDTVNYPSAVTASANLPLYYQQPGQAQLNALPLTLNQLEQTPNNAFTAAGFTNPIYTVRPWGSSFYNGLTASATQRFSGGFQMKASYTWSHLLDNMTGPDLTGTGGLGWADVQTGWHTSIYDHRHVASLTALWDLGGIGRNSFSWVRDVLANMTLSGTYTYETPSPVPMTSGLDALLGSGFASSGVFVNPNGIPGTGTGVSPLTNSSGQVVAYMANNSSAQYVRAGRGTYPTGGMQLFPDMRPINNFNAAVFKRFALRDRFNIEIHGEAYNVLNHPQFVPGSLSSIGLGPSANGWNFLVPGNVGFGNVSQAFSSNPRLLQVGIRFQF